MFNKSLMINMMDGKVGKLMIRMDDINKKILGIIEIMKKMMMMINVFKFKMIDSIYIFNWYSNRHFYSNCIEKYS